MDYEKALKILGETDPSELEKELTELKNGNFTDEKELDKLLSETVGVIFAASKECKSEELYRIERNGGKVIENEEDLWNEETPKFSGKILFYEDPITPFFENKVAEGERVTILTYRKAVEENPLLLIPAGFPKDSSVFEILEKDGLSEEGRKNYLKICDYISKENDPKIIEKVVSLLDEDGSSNGFFAAGGETKLIAMKPEAAKIYFRCTSSILCRLVSSEENGEESFVKIEPLYHNKGAIIEEKEISYDDFGEVSCFTFEMNDYI